MAVAQAQLPARLPSVEILGQVSRQLGAEGLLASITDDLGVEGVVTYGTDAAVEAIEAAREGISPDPLKVVVANFEPGDEVRGRLYATFAAEDSRDQVSLVSSTAFHARLVGIGLDAPDHVSSLMTLNSRDALTGCVTLADLSDRLAAEIESCESGAPAFSLCFIDLDRFKKINDTQGHPKGNEILAAVGSALCNGVGPRETACRYGGDEFLVLLPATDSRAAFDRAIAIRRSVERAGDATDSELIRCSIGVATWQPGLSADEVIERADAAMRAAKTSEDGIVTSQPASTTAPEPGGADQHDRSRGAAPASLSLGGHAEGERFLEDSRERIQRRLSPREWRAELTMAVGFVIAALTIAALFPSDRDAPLLLVVELTAVFALCARIRFEVGSCHTFPTQLAFVPMLLLLPPAIVPFLVALGFSLDKGVDIVRGLAAPGRGITVLADSWFSIGPVLVMAAAAVGDPSMHHWPIYVAALCAQFTGETITAGTREWLHGGASGREQFLESAWIYLVDALLAPIGLVIALAAVNDPLAVLFVIPLAGLLLIFARERTDHVDSLLALREAYRGTAHVLGDVVEHDDAYTGEHTRGVTDLALQTAAELHLDETATRNVEFGAILHDVGKIAIPKRIVNKRGPLDEDEWAVIKTHTIEAQRMLDRIGGLMSGIGEIVRSAHERFDGKGYPDGLSGEDIPIEARIIFACDAFNAITTDRPYRRGRIPEEAVAELRANSGTQFDPAVVDAVVCCVERARARMLRPAAGG